MAVNNAVTIVRSDCDTYTVTNDEAVNNIGVRLDEFVDGAFVAGSWSAAKKPTETETVDISSDGVWRIVVGEDDGAGGFINLDYYDLVIYCALQTCMISFIETLLCTSSVDCTNTTQNYKDTLYIYNAFMTNYYVFMLELNGVYVNNFGYTVLDPNDLTRFTDIEALLTRMTEYCACLSLDDDDCGCGS